MKRPSQNHYGRRYVEASGFRPPQWHDICFLVPRVCGGWHSLLRPRLLEPYGGFPPRHPHPRHGDLGECFHHPLPLRAGPLRQSPGWSHSDDGEGEHCSPALGPGRSVQDAFLHGARPQRSPAAILLRHEGIGSHALFRKMRRATREPGWSWTELRAAKADRFPKIYRELSNVRLLAQLSGLLLSNSKGLVAGHRQAPPPPPLFGDNSGSGCVW